MNIFEQGKTLYTQNEFNDALAKAKAEIMAIAIQATKQAIAIEREECAKIAEDYGAYEGAGELIRNRMRPKND